MSKKKNHANSPSLFNEEFVPAESGSGRLFDIEYTARNQPVTCLGMTFKDDEARRLHFTEELRKKLKDPDFRKIEGFPIGEDEDILTLSDPPFYTACPNPWIADFIAEWDAQKPSKPEGWTYHREPFAADVSEGKNDPIYNAHSYHTKVPHKAIMRYILHYTEPGDIIFDGFCGTGMTGVAAQMCGDREVVMSLGYQVKPDGTIMQEASDENGEKVWRAFSQLGVRRAVLNDLSPAATFIAYNYNTPVHVATFEKEAVQILKEVEDECGWMYETLHTDGKTIGTINYTIWSDAFACPECASEVVFWETAIDKENADVKDKFPCPHCKALLSKNIANRVWTTTYDTALKATIRHAKQVPALIIYSIEGHNKRFEKIPDSTDIKKIRTINELEIAEWFPTAELPDGYNTRQPIRSHGFDRVHHFYTRRNLVGLASLFSKAKSARFKYLFSGFVGGATRLNQLHLKNYVFGGGGFNPGPRKGTLYAPSISMEVPIFSLFTDRLRTQSRAFKSQVRLRPENFVLSVSSSSRAGDSTNDGVLDYVFIDPPFGANLNYSELSFIWESWFKVFTNNKPEAIENPVQNKGAFEYRQLMTECFKEVHRLLKPGRWMTVEFSNTQASVWNNIQTSLQDAGFIVANVSALDKKQGGINANISRTAVKQDLVISAYKPNGGFEGDVVVGEESISLTIRIDRHGIVKVSGERLHEKRIENDLFDPESETDDFIKAICGFSPNPVIESTFLFFHSYRKVQEGNPELAMMVDRGRAVRRGVYRPEQPMSAFKLRILRSLMGQANLFEFVDDQESDEVIMQLNELVVRYAGGTINKLRSSPDNTVDFRVKPTKGGDSFTFDGLSSGQKEIISTLFLIWYHTRKSPSVVFIDEPEMHLNAQWHRSFVKQLMRLAPKNQYILATHSEDIMDSVPDDRRLLLVSDEGVE